MGGWVDGRMDGWMGGWGWILGADGWMDVAHVAWIGGWADGWTGGSGGWGGKWWRGEGCSLADAAAGSVITGTSVLPAAFEHDLDAGIAW